MRTERLARRASILALVVVVAGCSNPVTPTPTASESAAPTVMPSPSATPSPAPSPTATPRSSPKVPATLKRGPTMKQARSWATAVSLGDGRVLIMGGQGACTVMDCSGTVTASVEVYKAGKFSSAGSLAEARASAQALLLPDGRVLVYGGFRGFLQLASMEIYSPATRTSVMVKLPHGVTLPADATIVLLGGRRVLIAGGAYDKYYSSMVRTTLIFDPANGSFIKGPDLAQARGDACAMVLRDGSVLIAGGGSPSAELIDPRGSKSTLIAANDPALEDWLTLLADGRILVTAKYDYQRPGIFDPATGRFTLTSPMATFRTSTSAAVALPDGRALVFGSTDATNAAVATIEAFDPVSEKFQVVEEGFPNISMFAAALTASGEVLFAGALDDSDGQPTADTWLITP